MEQRITAASSALIKGWEPDRHEIHKRILLVRHPQGMPVDEDFKLVEGMVPVPPPGKLLVKTLYLSLDPFHRMVMNPTPRNAEVLPLYGVMIGDVVGHVVKSNHPNFSEHDIVNGVLGWQSHAITDGAGHYIHNASGLRKVDPSHGPVHSACGVLGRTGLTAYFSVVRECNPKKNDVMLVSTAAGAVGHLAGQIGKILGCTVIGLTSTEEKVKFLTDTLGYDDAINYKKVNDIGASIRRVCPRGIDIFYDNVGGHISDAAHSQLNSGGRVTYVGVTDNYNEVGESGEPFEWKMDRPSNLPGDKTFMFNVHDYRDHNEDGREQLSRWINEGKLIYHADIWNGLENAPRAWIDMMNGGNMGKRVVQVAKEPDWL